MPDENGTEAGGQVENTVSTSPSDIRKDFVAAHCEGLNRADRRAFMRQERAHNRGTEHWNKAMQAGKRRSK